MAESSGDQSSGFWTLTRPSKLSKRRNSDLHDLHHKVFNVCVVGLSGVERDKGPIGIGKSCLCNRFVRSAADDYNTDHISVLSQSDFSGRVVNNDHWLYWGSVIKSCDGYDLAFNVIEQTEFVDDVCFQPFKSGKTEPYYKRCANTKLVSAEKLQYICKNQLGIEREYEQRYLPDGKFNVDGFLCLFDVSEVQGRNVDKQIEMTNLMMLNLIKTRKPIVFVTTKHDEANELLVAEAERLANQRDFRGLVPIVETSAQENVNINMAFLVCAQLIDKTRAKLRVPPYFEAYKNHHDLLNAATDAYIGLIRSTVVDYRSSWPQVCIKLSHNPEFLQYTYLHGLDKATAVFQSYLNQLRDECIRQKVQNYLTIFPDILDELVPSINIKSGNNNIVNDDFNSQDLIKFPSSPQAWELAKEQMRSHPLFSKNFIQLPSGISWYDTELLQSSDNRIPSDWLESAEAYSIFQQKNLIQETEHKRQITKDMFARMLSNTKIPIGKPFVELKHIFAGNSNLEILNDQELFEIYVEYQNNLLQQARADFQELLLENAEHLHHLTSSNKVIRQEDIKTINAILQHDERYQALDRFDQDRTLMMIRHLSFLHSQISEQCPSYPKCVEPEVERLLITKAKSLVSKYFENKSDNKSTSSSIYSHKTCDLVIFGPRRPSQQLILALNVLNSRAPKQSQYQITFTVFDNADELDTQLARFRQSNSKPKGCFGIFTNKRSLEHVSFTLEKFMILNSQVQSDKNHFGSPPIVMLYAADITLDERTMLALENEGQQMADKFKCPFMNVTAIDQYRQHQQNNILNNEAHDSTSQVMSECASLDYACVDAAFNVLKEAVSRRVCFMELYNNQDLIPRQAFNPDACILMCLLCGEPFSNELFMWKMFLDYEDCYVTSSKSICLKVKLNNGQDKFIEVIITSYTHGAFNYREDLLHGFILVCSIQRKASISILNAFSFNIPCTPVLVMAIKSDVVVKSNSACSQVTSEKESETLIKEAQAAAQRLKGHFELLDVNEDDDEILDDAHNIKKMKGFLQSVIERKPTIEKAYELGEKGSPFSGSTSQAFEPPAEYFPSSGDLKKTSDKLQTSILRDRSAPLAAPVSNPASASSSSKAASACRVRNAANILSSDDELNDPSEPLDKRDLSDESEAYSTVSNSAAPPKPQRLTKQDREDTSLNEVYAKRPLPPIPSALDRNATDREIELPSSTATASLLSGQLNHQHQHHFHSKLETAKQTQASEETNDSSSGGDTEDSSENKLDKPKPGKLDLRQFDNITNAIGKLNVQPTSSLKTMEAARDSASKSQDGSQPHDSGFFKSRTTKSKTSKSRTKDLIQKETKESGSDDQLASFVLRRQHSDLRGGLGFSASSSSNREPQKRVIQEQEGRRRKDIDLKHNKESPTPIEVSLSRRKSSDELDDNERQPFVVGSSVKERSSRFKNEKQQPKQPLIGKAASSAASSFLKSSSSDIDSEKKRASEISAGKNLPRAAPRTALASVAATTTPTSKTSTNVPSGEGSFGGGSASQPFASFAPTCLVKRSGNLRQNHGRAVAPPQLPGNASILSSSPNGRLEGTSTDQQQVSSELPIHDSVAHLVNDESAIDSSQSPIAQRLLKNAKDHKVSELNSPYESDNEPSQGSSNILRNQRLYRGQSFGSQENNAPGSFFTNSSIDSSELINSRGAAIRQLNEILANKQPPGRLGAHKQTTSRSSSLDQEQPPSVQAVGAAQTDRKNDKDVKKDKKKLRDDEKLEKRRLKEEEKLRRQEKKLAAKKSKSGAANATGSVGDDGIPFFIKKCIEFIEFEGLDAEGIYRVPGNRAHVDAFVQKFKENPDMSIIESDIPVNAVATALKDFLSKKWGPIIPLALMNELTELSSVAEKEKRVQAVRQLVKKLPPTNYNLLKYVFSHFVKVSLNHSLNSMDSKNLAICWWPTLLPLHFSDMVMFEQMRPHLEESIQTMIDQYDFIFDGEESEPAVA